MIPEDIPVKSSWYERNKEKFNAKRRQKYQERARSNFCPLKHQKQKEQKQRAAERRKEQYRIQDKKLTKKIQELTEYYENIRKTEGNMALAPENPYFYVNIDIMLGEFASVL